jgi:dihydroneopterin aldolase
VKGAREHESGQESDRLARTRTVRLDRSARSREKRPPTAIGDVEVDVEGLTDENDQIDRTFDYDKVYDFIKSLENTAHNELQETVARRVLGFVQSSECVIRATVETRKPDIFDDCAYVGVRLEGSVL